MWLFLNLEKMFKGIYFQSVSSSQVYSVVDGKESELAKRSYISLWKIFDFFGLSLGETQRR